MPIPSINFGAIRDLSQEALAMLGTPILFTEQGAPTGRTVWGVIYRQTNRDPKNDALLNDAEGETMNALLSPADFKAPARFPQQFDTLTVDIEGFARIYSIEAVHPVLAGNTLPLLMAQVKGN
jgi:hypothetical protein